MIATNTNYEKAYTEFLCILEYMPQSYIDKIPNTLLEIIKEQFNKEYIINIDINKSLIEQNLSKTTKDLIAYIKYNCWSTEEEKIYLKKIFSENEKQYQEELSNKYNSDSIFKGKNQLKASTDISNSNTQLSIYKENIFTKILNTLKKVFFRK